MIIKDLLEKLQSPENIKKWKESAKLELTKLAKSSNPFKQLKVTGYYFYVDTKSRSFAIILQGVKPNLGHTRGFTAPVNQREKTPKPRHFYGEGGWKTVDTQRKSSNSAGSKPLQTSYFGVSGNPTQFYGLRRRGGIEAFGLINETPVPVYSEYGFVEYLTESETDSFTQALLDAGYSVLEGV
jgi:hypothetical protein